MLYQYAANCDKMAVLENEISDVIGLAVAQNMEDWQYPLVAKSVVDALNAVLPDMTTDTLRAWMDGLGYLATHFGKLAEEFKKNPYYKTYRLSEKTVQLLKSSAPELKEKGTMVATHLFTSLFERYPVFRDLFPKIMAEK